MLTAVRLMWLVRIAVGVCLLQVWALRVLFAQLVEHVLFDANTDANVRSKANFIVIKHMTES